MHSTPFSPIACERAGAQARAATRHPNRILDALPETELVLLVPHLRVVSLRAGTVLQREGDPISHVYFPHNGLVSMFATTPDRQTVEAASTGRAGACPLVRLGEREGFLTAVVEAAVRTSRIQASQLDAAERESDTLRRLLGACREILLLEIRHNLACVAIHSAEQRLSRWLLEAADRLGGKTILITQEQIAQRLAVRRTTVNLVAKALQDAGVICWSRSRVDIVDRARLELAACSCYAGLRERIAALLSTKGIARGPETWRIA